MQLRDYGTDRSGPDFTFVYVRLLQGCRHNDFGNQLRANRWEGFKEQ